MSQNLVLGIDSSTQSTKALLVDAEDGRVVDQRTALRAAVFAWPWASTCRAASQASATGWCTSAG